MTLPPALPVARTPDPMAAPPLRWGVAGPGWIAERFVQSLQQRTRQMVVAVASRSADRASAFAERLGVARSYGSYEALVSDPGIVVVYVSTPHNAHHPVAMLAIQAGKHTLVEKPIGINAGEAGQLADAARAKGVFLMEALWTLFLPKFDVLRQIVDDGLLGDLKTVVADNGEYFPPDHRIMRAELAGGPLLDLGTYPVMLATWRGDSPTRPLAASVTTLTVMDEVRRQLGIVFDEERPR